MKGESLGIPEEEFQDYVSGRAVPSESWENYFSEPLHVMQEMSNMLTDLDRRHKDFLKNVESLRRNMESKQVDYVYKLPTRKKFVYAYGKPRKL